MKPELSRGELRISSARRVEAPNSLSVLPYGLAFFEQGAQALLRILEFEQLVEASEVLGLWSGSLAVVILIYHWLSIGRLGA
jgi:hypothetical protein